MARRTAQQNANLAQRIRTRLGNQIRAACAGSIVPESFLAGIISVENAPLSPNAKRFEPAIFRNLSQVRDGTRTSFNNIRRAQLSGINDAALRNLATSFSFTQILGLHVIATFNNEVTVAQLRDPQQHLPLAVRFITIEGGNFLEQGAFDNVLRIHNTGRPNGQTFDPDYVPNAIGVMRAYAALP